MDLKERIKVIIMGTPFCDLENAIDELVESIPDDITAAAAEIEDLKTKNDELMQRIRKVEEENHDLRRI